MEALLKKIKNQAGKRKIKNQNKTIKSFKINEWN
jgi:hypothetical protein